ncbi:MAG: glycosyltransferase [Spirochaetia bacterium]|nr:glycosyltransferase [Spirochaetia bacterium]
MDTGSGFSIFGIPVSNVTMKQALAQVQAFCDEPSSNPKEMHFVNAHCINVAYKNKTYRDVLSQSSAVFADGSGVRIAGKWLGTVVVDNVNGTDMFPLLCKLCAEKGYHMYLLGAGPAIAEKAAKWAEDYTKVAVVSGYHDGFFDVPEEKNIIDEINSLKPEILLVAMGVPKQELWLHEHLGSLQCKVVMGVGGLFDFYSGTISRAPVWMRSIGFEWVWRLIKEPRRMWRRYIIGNVVFLVRMRVFAYKMRRST